MDDQERNQQTWDRMSPEAKNMVLNIDPNFTPDKLPTPVNEENTDTYLDSVEGYRADYIYRSTYKEGVLVSKQLTECIPHEGIMLFDVAGYYLGLKTQSFVRKYILAESVKDAKKQYKNLFGWKAKCCEKVTDPKERYEVLHNHHVIPF